MSCRPVPAPRVRRLPISPVRDFATYLPRYLKKRRHARRVETVLAPLFPRYLFVAVDMATQRWRSISSTFGVTQLVCNGDDPAPIADDIIDEFAVAKTNMGPFVFPRGLALRRAIGFVCSMAPLPTASGCSRA